MCVHVPFSDSSAGRQEEGHEAIHVVISVFYFFGQFFQDDIMICANNEK